MPDETVDAEAKIPEVLNALFASAEDWKAEKDRKLAEAFYGNVPEHIRKTLESGGVPDPEDLYDGTVRVARDLVSGLARKAYGSPKSGDFAFLIENLDFVKDSFERIINDIDGPAFCADRSSTVVKAVARKLLTWKPVEFDYSGEYTFHLPERVFRTEDEIMGFFKALMNLRYGAYANYLKELYAILSKYGKSA